MQHLSHDVGDTHIVCCLHGCVCVFVCQCYSVVFSSDMLERTIDASNLETALI
jgi:hypothetical protein